MAADDKMSQEDRLFWVALTVFGGIFATGLFIAFEQHLAGGVALTVLGLGGLLRLVRDHRHHRTVKLNLLIALALVTWGSLGYSFYDRHRNTVPTGVIKGWGRPRRLANLLGTLGWLRADDVGRKVQRCVRLRPCRFERGQIRR
jgi:hypothetical protein